MIGMGLLESDGVYLSRLGVTILPAFAPISNKGYKQSLKYVDFLVFHFFLKIDAYDRV
jgi:hypothetical protein